MSCMRPWAPLRETARVWKPLSALITQLTKSGSSRLRSLASRTSWLMSGFGVMAEDVDTFAIPGCNGCDDALVGGLPDVVTGTTCTGAARIGAAGVSSFSKAVISDAGTSMYPLVV